MKNKDIIININLAHHISAYPPRYVHSTMLIGGGWALLLCIHVCSTFGGVKKEVENDVLFSNDTGILGKRNSEFSQQESNLRPSDY